MNLDRPLIVFDLETTGTKPATDRICSLAYKKLIPGLPQENCLEDYFEFNPGQLLSPEVEKLTGLTNERLSANPPFSSFATHIHEVFAGCDLAGFNVIQFDVPMLWEEFFRVRINWDLEGVRIIDAGNIFKKKEERTLTAAVQFYCGRKLEGAHDARVDVDATLDVLNGQLARYEDLNSMTTDQLAEFSRFDKRLDLAGVVVFDESGVPCFNIGKAKGTPVMMDRGFGKWVLSNDFSENTKQVIRRIYEHQPQKPSSPARPPSPEVF